MVGYVFGQRQGLTVFCCLDLTVRGWLIQTRERCPATQHQPFRKSEQHNGYRGLI